MNDAAGAAPQKCLTLSGRSTQMQPERIDLMPHDVHVWYQHTESISLPALTAAKALLSADERARCDRLRLARDRRDYIAAHALVRLLLSHYSAVEPRALMIETTPWRKPELAPRTGATHAGLRFNLSHARGIVACAITTDKAVGIDVEQTDLSFDCSSISSRYCADEEIARLDRCDPQDRSARFVELWTLKEAYLKATGEGLSGGLRHLGFDVDGDQVRLLPTSGVDAGEWQFALFPVLPHARIGVAVNCRYAPRWTLTGLDAQSRPAAGDGQRQPGDNRTWPST
jgi:4'-phosphopantetheinyl transferase